MPFIYFIQCDRLRSISTITMSSSRIFILFIIINRLSLVDLRLNRLISSDTTCVPIPFLTLSSRNDEKFGQLKLFSSPQFSSNLTMSCGKFSM